MRWYGFWVKGKEKTRLFKAPSNKKAHILRSQIVKQEKCEYVTEIKQLDKIQVPILAYAKEGVPLTNAIKKVKINVPE